MVTEDLRDYFSRHFLGRVKVHRLSHDVPPPTVCSFKRTLETHPVRMRMKVVGSALFAPSGVAHVVHTFRFSEQFLKVKGAKLARYAPDTIRTGTVRPLKKTTVREDRKRAEVLPQERTNRLQWQAVRPANEGEMILGWFGPIVEDAVVKLTLNRQQGTLLIWYNPQSRRYNARGLYLYRRLGLNENLEWRWV